MRINGASWLPPTIAGGPISGPDQRNKKMDLARDGPAVPKLFVRCCRASGLANLDKRGVIHLGNKNNKSDPYGYGRVAIPPSAKHTLPEPALPRHAKHTPRPTSANTHPAFHPRVFQVLHAHPRKADVRDSSGCVLTHSLSVVPRAGAAMTICIRCGGVRYVCDSLKPACVC